MELNNYTPFASISWENVDANNNWYATLISRVKLDITASSTDRNLELKLSKDQGELFSKDTYYGEVGESSVQYESDYITYKPNTDVILNANAISPKNKKRSAWDCGIRIFDNNQKLLKEYGLKVKGEKELHRAGLVWVPGFRKRSTQVPIRYERSAGGTIKKVFENKEDKHIKCNYYNPVGCGMKKVRDPKSVVYVPQIKYLYKKIGKVPAGFGFINRAWKSRLKYAGTYDQKWIETQHPLPPHDFDPYYNQAAHPELIMKGYLKEGTKIELINLLEGREKYSFTLPSFDLVSRLRLHTGDIYQKMNLDTLIIDINSHNKEEHCIYASYRVQIPIKEDIELAEIMLVQEEVKNG